MLRTWVKGQEHDSNSLVDTRIRTNSIPIIPFHNSQVAAAYIKSSMITSKLAPKVHTQCFQSGLKQTICKRHKYVTEIYLWRLIKKRHCFSLSVWDFQNYATGEMISQSGDQTRATLQFGEHSDYTKIAEASN